MKTMKTMTALLMCAAMAFPTALTPVCAVDKNDLPAVYTADEEWIALSINKKPDKLYYHIGEELDLTGGMADACGQVNNKEWKIPSAPIDSEYFDVDASEFDNTKPGAYTIYVTCKGETISRTESFEVTVERNPDHLEQPTTVGKPSENITFYITKLPDKLEYKLGEKLDLTGGMAFAGGQYDDGSGNIMCWDDFEQPMTYYEVDDSAFNSDVPGFYPIYLTCKGQLESDVVSFNVLVGELPTTLPPETTEPAQQETFFVFHRPNKIYYNLGENLDLSGGYAWTQYWNGDSYVDLTEKVPLTDSSITIDDSEYDNTKPGVYTIRVNKYYDFSVVVLDENGNPPEGIPAPTEATDGTISVAPTTITTLTGNDLNGDGSEDILDIITINKYMLGIYRLSDSALAFADVNGDGKIDSADSIAMLKKVLGIEEKAAQDPEEPTT